MEFGSKEHRALLGIDDPNIKPERKAELELALGTKPASQVNPDLKVPVTAANYDPTTRYGVGDEIIDGWTRYGYQS